jgi:hypothetical protein
MRYRNTAATQAHAGRSYLRTTMRILALVLFAVLAELAIVGAARAQGTFQLRREKWIK